jgi:DNA-binding LacI/PurR family transcriptional regulator
MAAVREYGINLIKQHEACELVEQHLGLNESDISNNFYASVARQLEDLAWEQGYNLIIGSTDEMWTRS